MVRATFNPLGAPARADASPRQGAVAYLDQFVNYEQATPASYDGTFSLDTIRRLLTALGSPERRWPAIHVAGTKGKGSTCALMASILQAAGCRVGLYTSPHLVDLRERIQVDGQWVTEAELADAVEALRLAVESLETPPTWFEACTAMAFWLFARRQVEVAVIEVGLGGRLDATNVVESLVAVIAPISYDHTDVLGTTLAAIATEKAGIVKPGRPVVVAPQAPEVLAVIRRTAQARRAPCLEVAARIQSRLDAASVSGQRVTLQTPRGVYPAISLPLLGAHQVTNLATAVTALEALPAPWTVTPAAVADGVACVRWPGRLQVVARRPWLVVDGAQNAASAAALRDAIRALWPGRRLHLIAGLSANKDVEGFAEALAPLGASVMATQAQVPRALPASRLAARLRPWFPMVETVDTVAEAVARARRRASPDDCLVVTGSFFVIGELLRVLGDGPGPDLARVAPALGGLPGARPPDQGPPLGLVCPSTARAAPARRLFAAR